MFRKLFDYGVAGDNIGTSSVVLHVITSNVDKLLLNQDQSIHTKFKAGLRIN